MKKRLLASFLAFVMLFSLFPVNALAAGGGNSGSSTNYNVYYYTLIPGKDLNSTTNPNENWNGMGVGRITGVNAPSSYSLGTYITAGTHMEPDGYPDLAIDGTTYQYAATGSENADKEGYYTIEWIRTIVANGANAGNNGYNPVVDSRTNTFHRDGQVFANEKDMYTVTFRIQQPGETTFTIQDDYSKRVPKDTQESNLTKPSTADKTVDGIEYTFDGWYKDEACTVKANFDGTITANTNYYGKYVQKYYTVTYDRGDHGNLAGQDSNGQVVYTQREYRDHPKFCVNLRCSVE